MFIKLTSIDSTDQELTVLVSTNNLGLKHIDPIDSFGSICNTIVYQNGILFAKVTETIDEILKKVENARLREGE